MDVNFCQLLCLFYLIFLVGKKREQPSNPGESHRVTVHKLRTLMLGRQGINRMAYHVLEKKTEWHSVEKIQIKKFMPAKCATFETKAGQCYS
jgi:hypothetical protein